MYTDGVKFAAVETAAELLSDADPHESPDMTAYKIAGLLRQNGAKESDDASLVGFTHPGCGSELKV